MVFALCSFVEPEAFQRLLIWGHAFKVTGSSADSMMHLLEPVGCSIPCQSNLCCSVAKLILNAPVVI